MAYAYGTVLQADVPDVMEVPYSGGLSSPVIAHWTDDRANQFAGLKTTTFFTGKIFIGLQ